MSLDHYAARLVCHWILFFARFDQVHRYIHMPLDHYAAQLVCRWIILPLDLAKSAVTYVARSLCRSISLLLDHAAARFGQVRRYILPLDHYAARLVCRWIILPLDLAKSAVT